MSRQLLTRLACMAIVVCILAGAISYRVTAEDTSSSATTLVAQKSTPQLKAFMRKKLVAAEQIMEGLATTDYGLIRKGATAMIHMSKEAMWETQGTAVYAQDSADFVRSAERLIKLSNAKDLEGASHTYANLTIRCVDCHRRARSEKGVAMREAVSGLAILD